LQILAEFLNDYKELYVNGRMELRIKFKKLDLVKKKLTVHNVLTVYTVLNRHYFENCPLTKNHQN